jgi:hypothetical protein
MKTFSQRLALCLDRGQMAQGDLRWWFGRSYSTTASWLQGTRSPRKVAAGAEAWRRLALLEDAIRLKKGFPVPHDLSLTARPHHIEKLYHDNSAGISRKNTARGRIQMRNGAA